jgi:PadR family transcriptional regulator, regulatory protein PadR
MHPGPQDRFFCSGWVVHCIDRYLAWHYCIEVPDFYENWTTQLRKGLLELAILNALSDGPLYGYEIVRRLGDVDGLVITEGTVYPILSRLKNEAYVETYLQESSEGPPRKYYRLTGDGRGELRRMNEHWERLHGAIQLVRKESR